MEIEYNEKMDKRLESKSILDYIFFFKKFHSLFIAKEEDITEHLVENLDFPDFPEDMLDVAKQINEFYFNKPLSIEQFEKIIINKFWNLTTKISNNNNNYKVLLSEKTKLIYLN